MIGSVRSIVVLAVFAGIARAETGYDAWLRYAPIDQVARKTYAHLPAAIFVAGASPLLETAKNELIRGVGGMLGKAMQVESHIATGGAIMLATYDVTHGLVPGRDGVARYKLFAGGRQIAEWPADDTLPSDRPNRHTSARKTITGVALRAGDEIRIEAKPDANDHADVDYVEIVPVATRR